MENWKICLLSKLVLVSVPLLSLLDTYMSAVQLPLIKVYLGILQDTVFDPVSLSCGHIFCYMCCCSAGSTTIVDGLKFVNPKAKCPLCRQVHFLLNFFDD